MHLSHQVKRNTKSNAEDPHPTFYRRTKEKRLLMGYNNFSSMRHVTGLDEENIHFVKGYN